MTQSKPLKILKNLYPTRPNPTQPNPWVDPTHRQLWVSRKEGDLTTTVAVETIVNATLKPIVHAHVTSKPLCCTQPSDENRFVSPCHVTYAAISAVQKIT